MEKKRFRLKKTNLYKLRSIISLVLMVVSLAATTLVLQREKFFSLWSEATGSPANLVIQVQLPQGTLPRPWIHLAQGGEDLSQNMIAPVINQTRNLSPQTIRIDHIYDGYDMVSRDDSGQLAFNFSRLDEVVNSIRQTGAIPMLSLSYMPPAISSGDIVDKPKDWNEWGLVVQKTIEHYSGSLNIPNMAYEVWNEPDLFGGWKTYGDKNYLELYEWAAVGAGRAKVNQSFSFGGPATTGAYEDWTRKMLDLAAQKNLRLDFLSWHRYSLNIADYENDRTLVRRILNQYPRFSGATQLYITELGPNSEVNPVNDSTAAAAHLISVVREGLGEIDRFYTFEIVDGKNPEGKDFWGRWGLITHPDTGAKIKPRYQALQFLNKLIGTRLSVAGEGSWVKAIAARGSDGIVRVLIVNYDKFGKHREEIPLTIEGLIFPAYSLKNTLLGGGTTTAALIPDNNGSVRTALSLPANGIILLEITPG